MEIIKNGRASSTGLSRKHLSLRILVTIPASINIWESTRCEAARRDAKHVNALQVDENKAAPQTWQYPHLHNASAALSGPQVPCSYLRSRWLRSRRRVGRVGSATARQRHVNGSDGSQHPTTHLNKPFGSINTYRYLMSSSHRSGQLQQFWTRRLYIFWAT